MVIIVGGGLVGKLAALACKFPVKIIEKNILKIDNRASAISYSSCKILKDICDIDISTHSEPISSIHVYQEEDLLGLEWESKKSNPYGYNIYNEKFHEIIDSKIRESKNIEIINANVSDYIDHNVGPEIILDNGESIKGMICLAADGSNSLFRERITETDIIDYKQSAIFGIITHENDHLGRSYERFFKWGTFATIPLKKNKSTFVCCMPKSTAYDIYNSEEKVFSSLFNFVEEDFGSYTSEILGSFPLYRKIARKFGSGWICLIGDSAHTIHPVAGQGLNLSIRDVKCIAEIVQKNSPLNISSEYHRKRYIDVNSLSKFTNGILNIFSNEKISKSMLSNIPRLGMRMLNSSKILKSLFNGFV
jgi:2-octaprenyl-6-methoxyphenol hydroxylase